MYFMKHLRFIPSVLLLCLMACGKVDYQPTDKDVLPAKTTTGENTLGFYLNGLPFVAMNDGAVKGIDLAVYYKNDHKLFLRASNHTTFQDDYFLTFQLGDYLHGKGAYMLKDVALDTKVIDRLIVDERDGIEFKTSFPYFLDTNRSNIIKFNRYDLSAGIISGVFEFMAVNDSLRDTIRVVDGRFDLGGLLIVE